MSWLFEDPTTIVVAGLLIEALLVVALVKTGRGILVLAMVGVLALMGLGLLIEALLVVALVKTGRGVLVLAMAGVLAIMGLGLLVERLVVTDREQIEATLDGVKSALEANDVEGVLSYIDPAASGMRANVRAALAGVRVTEARVYDLEVEVDRHANPATAQAEFTGRVKGNYRGESANGEGMVLRKFIIDFRQQEGRWLMTAYEDRGTIGGRRDD